MPTEQNETSAPLAEIAHGPSPFEQFLDKYQKSLVVFAILIVVAAAGLVVFRGIEHSRQINAGGILSKAAGLPELRKLVEDHGGTQAAKTAAILLAEEQWTAGQQDASIATLRGFIESNSKHAALASARASLGSKLMTQGHAAKASAVFQQIVDDPASRYLAPFALISLGDLARVAGDAANAETLYNRARADHPESGFASTATERLASLNASMPTEVDPPPAAEEDAPAADDAAAAPDLSDAAPEIIPDESEPAQSTPGGDGETEPTPPANAGEAGEPSTAPEE